MSQHSNLSNHPVYQLSDSDLQSRPTHSEPNFENLSEDALDAAISRVLARSQAVHGQKSGNTSQLLDTPAAAKMIYGARRKIDDVFGVNGFSVSPAWDIMLDLYIARAGDRAISTSSACIGAACPPTTGLRWLRILEQQALVTKTDDATDGRRSFYNLTSTGVSLTEEAIRATFSSS